MKDRHACKTSVCVYIVYRLKQLEQNYNMEKQNDSKHNWHKHDKKQILRCKKFESHTDSLSVLLHLVSEQQCVFPNTMSCYFAHFFGSSFIHCVLKDMNTVSQKTFCY